MRARFRIAAVLAVVGFAATSATMAVADERAVQPSVVARNLEVPWGIDFLPDGTALIAERDSARVLTLSDGQVSELRTIQGAQPRGEGGLLGLAVSPNYETDKYVYVYYTAVEDNRIARFRPGEPLEPIVTGIPKDIVHNGGRLKFGPDGMLYATTGDATDTGNSQDLNSLAGKILRMTPEGEPAPNNPFDNSLVYSYGHRNPQGLTWDAQGRMFSSELGQDTWDELNRIQAGKNYGWPTCEGECGDAEFVDPLLTWRTSEASPSGAAVYQGHVYIAALRGERLWRAPIQQDGNVGEPEELFTGEYGRLRTPVVAPDGTLWVSTSNRDGRGRPASDDDRIISISGTAG